MYVHYRKCKEFKRKLKKIGKFADPNKAAEALSNLTRDMREDGFEFPLVYRCNVRTVMHLLEEHMSSRKRTKLIKLKPLWFFIKGLAIVLGLIVSVIIIIRFFR